MLIIGLVLVLTAGAFGAWTLLLGEEAAAAGVELESIGDPGTDPFTDPVAPEPAGSLLDYASGTDKSHEEVTTELAGYQAPDGSVPGVYGGSLNEAACDPDLLEQFLTAEPEKAASWAAVVQISPDDLSAYLGTLTPVNLASDTRVINHGFDDGEAVPRESVLQRGSAVMVDERGVPRVDCYSGGPLLAPEPLEEESFEGEPWAGFERSRVIVVGEAPAQVETFELRDVESGELFSRPAGSRGEADRPGMVDLVDDGPIEFDTTYEDFLIEGRTQARYLFDPPDGAILTIRVANRRDSQSRMRTQVVSEGSGFVDFRLSPGASDEATITLDHQGAAPFEIIFTEGPAAYDFEIELATQQDAGRSGDAGDDFGTAFEAPIGEPVEGALGGKDSTDVYTLDLQPGSEMVFDAAVTRDSPKRARFRIVLEGNTLFDERVSPSASTSHSRLFSVEDAGTLEVIINEGGADYAFRLDFDEQTDGGQPGDAGDELADARQVRAGEQLAGQVGGRDPADWYLFEAPADNVEIAVVNDVESSKRVRMRVQNDRGSTVADTRVNPGSEDALAFEAEAGAEYRLIVGEGGSNYGFEIRELMVTDDG